ncbi:unnamed protein product [Amoebophrya sp. A120]|nr:unnamed protein product [Amoebophrya sp. A120]|eukprot:GSA120T00004946001.1
MLNLTKKIFRTSRNNRPRRRKRAVKDKMTSHLPASLLLSCLVLLGGDHASAELAVDMSPPPTKTCADEPWTSLQRVLQASAPYPAEMGASPDFVELTNKVLTIDGEIIDPQELPPTYEAGGSHPEDEKAEAGTRAAQVEDQNKPQSLFAYFREHFKECREGFLSFLIYLSLHHPQHSASFKTLAKDFARELNPLALRQPDLLSWPLFGQVEQVIGTYDVEDNVISVDAKPRFPYFVKVKKNRWNHGGRSSSVKVDAAAELHESENTTFIEHIPNTRISPMLGMVHSNFGLQGSLDLLRRISEPAFVDSDAAKPTRRKVVFDVGVFDGGDWAKAIVELGCIGVGFEMVKRNRNLMRKNFPYWRKENVEGPVPVVPGKLLPEKEFVNKTDAASSSGVVTTTAQLAAHLQGRPVLTLDEIAHVKAMNEQHILEERERLEGKDNDNDKGDTKADHAAEKNATPQPGFFHLIGAALGAAARAQKVLSRYDYTSLALMGYLDGPPDMEEEEVAVVTLDDLFGLSDATAATNARHFPAELKKIDLLKIDTEGAELYVLKGAERLLQHTMVHYLVFEYQPAMLANTGTDHVDLLHFVAHYGFECFSLKLPTWESMSFEAFAAQYVRKDRLRLKGMGFIEDIICENRYWVSAETEEEEKLGKNEL